MTKWYDEQPNPPPPASDEWKPRGKGRNKPFGVRITFGPGFFKRTYEWTQWYPTKRAQEDAIRATLKKNVKGHAIYKKAVYTAEPVNK